MASEVDICNLALSHLGDSATVASIDPPEGSAQAEHCQRFYPIARDTLLEMHTWGFATRRAALALLANSSTDWAYCYAQPADLVNATAVLDPNVTEEAVGAFAPQPYVLEVAPDGTEVVYTNQAGAVMRYVSLAPDPTKFSPLFTMTLSWSLASLLAGPVIKGEAGAAMAARCSILAFGRDGRSGLFGQAAGSDSRQSATSVRDRHTPAWVDAR